MKPATKGKQIPKACGFRIVRDGDAILFEPGGRKSPYLQAIQELIKAGPGKLLEFDNPGSRPSIYQAARKHNIKVMFAEKDGKLYLRLQDISGPETTLLNFLKEGPRPIADIEQYLKGLGLGDNVTGLLSDLSRNNLIALVTVGASK
jgi:hypothetical protein